MSITAAPDRKRVVVVSAGTGNPSSTRRLTDGIAQKSLDLLKRAGTPATATVIELGPLAVDTAPAAVAGFPGEQLQAAIDRLATADAIIATTPVCKAAISGLFKSFVDVLDDDLIVAKPVLLAATGGTPSPRAGHRRPDAAAVRLHARPHPSDLGVRRARGLSARLSLGPASSAPPPSSRSSSEPASSSTSPTTPGRATSTSSPATPPAPTAPQPTSTSTPRSCDSPPAAARRARSATRLR